MNLRGLIKTGVALKAMEIIKREAAKPENQAKAKELARSLQEKMAQRKGSRSTGTTPVTSPVTSPDAKPVTEL